MTLRHQCSRDGCYKDKHLPDWSFLRGLFPRKIAPTDVDGWVELNGYHLYLEWKGPNAPVLLRYGQRRAYEERTTDGRSTVLILWGHVETSEVIAMQVIPDSRCRGRVTATNDMVRRVVAKWVRKVSGASLRATA